MVNFVKATKFVLPLITVINVKYTYNTILLWNIYIKHVDKIFKPGGKKGCTNVKYEVT